MTTISFKAFRCVDLVIHSLDPFTGQSNNDCLIPYYNLSLFAKRPQHCSHGVTKRAQRATLKQQNDLSRVHENTTIDLGFASPLV